MVASITQYSFAVENNAVNPNLPKGMVLKGQNEQFPQKVKGGRVAKNRTQHARGSWGWNPGPGAF